MPDTQPKKNNLSQELAGRAALVTGGSRGIGRATCLALAARGAAAAVHYNRSEAEALSVVEEIRQAGGQATAVQADLTRPGAGSALAALAAEALGTIDILVNNAALFTTVPVAEMTDQAWDRAMAINLTAVFQLTRACIPAMTERGWGRIVNVSSQAAYNGSANHAHYATAKAGLLGFTYSVAKELGPTGATINVIVPGRIATGMLLEGTEHRVEEWLQRIPLGRFGRPEEVAEAIAFLASDRAGYISGAALNVSGGQLMG